MIHIHATISKKIKNLLVIIFIVLYYLLFLNFLNAKKDIIFEGVKLYEYFKEYKLIIKIDKIYKKSGKILFFKTNIFFKIIGKNIEIKLFLKKNKNNLILHILKNKINFSNQPFTKIEINNPKIIYSKFPSITKIIINLKRNRIILFTLKKKFVINLIN